MKRIVLFICTLLGGVTCMHADNRFLPTDTRITYVGRVLVVDSMVCFDWAATMVRIAFEGTSLRMQCNDSRKDYFNLWADKQPSSNPDKILRVEGDTLLTLVEGLEKGSHQIILQKRTEGEQGKLTMQALWSDGELLPAMPLRPRQVEFIGDSYSCGFGVENSVPSDPFTPETENACRAFPAIVARAFDADLVMVAHSGFGICRNYNSKVAGYYLPERYTQTLDMVRDSLLWNAQKEELRPSITVIFLGGNDFSVGVTPNFKQFQQQYLALLKQIKTNYGSYHPILCGTRKGIPAMSEYVEKVVQNCPYENVHFVPCMDALYPSDETHLGACGHPNMQAQEKMAMMLLPYISSLTGWELPALKQGW